ncbi:hypothetical protein BJF93_03535 [Xaviernesmea oryzae]|uniref:O-antigen ligase-related domain-containing protein n=1 Tax=Xaviernesmea oryzae TaxID=464029 RepID=A0A1Q9AU80_9HYPH|nr:O-antigen ligase family protein [Xaviernesmea oryzae]OLP59013.1 hypothetical protein BJF93_03535 [Xaviernesmea oryzae]SEK90608.1 O-antigen ligase [Xaviernesmea oryzae]
MARIAHKVPSAAAGNFFAGMDKIDFLAVGFFLLVMVRFATGEADSESARALNAAAVESGDLGKQIGYTFLFGLLTALWLMKRGLSLPKSLGIIPILLIGWIVMTSSWAFAPNVSFRRAILLVFVFFSLAFVVDLLGPGRSIRALYISLGICIILSIICVFLVPSVGRHPMTEMDQGIAGGWRGIFIHKNTAGPVVSMAAMMFLHLGLSKGHRMHWFLFSCSVFFLLGSKAKTAMGLFLVVFAISLLFRLACSDIRFRLLVGTLVVLAIAGGAGMAFGYADALVRLFSDPEAFTGRVAIWQAAYDAGMDNFWKGVGYSSLWGVGEPPPIMMWARFPYLEFISHSHNGYLELFATTGIIGLVMAVWFAVVGPFLVFMRMLNSSYRGAVSALFAIWLFGVLDNFMETQLFTRDREIWVVYFSSILIVTQLYKEEVATRTRTLLNNSARRMRARMRLPMPAGAQPVSLAKMNLDTISKF